MTRPARGQPRQDRGPRPDERADGLRMFYALKVPAEVAEPLAEAQKALTRNWRAVRPDQLHVTLAYLPNVQMAQVEGLKALGRQVMAEVGPLQLRLRGTGYFPNEGSPRVWFVKVEAEGLDDLAARLRAGLDRLGVATDELPFKAHVTLARKKGPAPRVAPKTWDLGWHAGAFSLIHSTLRKTGPIYDTVATFTLSGQPPTTSTEPSTGPPTDPAFPLPKTDSAPPLPEDRA